MLSDLPRRLGIDFAARQCGELVTDIHHRVATLAFSVVDTEAETERTGLIPDLGNEAVSLVHLPDLFCPYTFGQICPTVKIVSGKNVRIDQTRVDVGPPKPLDRAG